MYSDMIVNVICRSILVTYRDSQASRGSAQARDEDWWNSGDDG